MNTVSTEVTLFCSDCRIDIDQVLSLFTENDIKFSPYFTENDVKFSPYSQKTTLSSKLDFFEFICALNLNPLKRSTRQTTCGLRFYRPCCTNNPENHLYVSSVRCCDHLILKYDINDSGKIWYNISLYCDT